ncbi:MAG: hypothetical protein IJN24_07820 [Bacteroidaceae bacterium]|nr:hypothetical protein [Bacteroidaceae bacterium]MBQ6694766.1 hypothetical protein [Bacteroidaceae bacterium]
MKKLLSCLLFAIAQPFTSAVAQENTVLSTQIYGYKGNMVHYDCVQTPLLAAEFYTNPGEEHLYKFTTDRLVCFLVNGKTKVLLSPGDSLHININYGNSKVPEASISGSENAIKTNLVMQDIENLKRDMRYKAQLLACVALDIKPDARINDSRTLLEKVKSMLAAAQLSEEAANYILSMTESDAYLSFMEYPVMYASVRGTAIEQQEIGDYWSIMEGFSPRSDAASLSCPEYASLLMRYSMYMNEKSAIQKGDTYNAPTRLEDMYSELATFYTGPQRDFVLYTLLCNFIQQGKEIERADALYKDYKEKYNADSRYIAVLDAILQ